MQQHVQKTIEDEIQMVNLGFREAVRSEQDIEHDSKLGSALVYFLCAENLCSNISERSTSPTDCQQARSST